VALSGLPDFFPTPNQKGENILKLPQNRYTYQMALNIHTKRFSKYFQNALKYTKNFYSKAFQNILELAFLYYKYLYHLATLESLCFLVI
jgi:hypothetical protein